MGLAAPPIHRSLAYSAGHTPEQKPLPGVRIAACVVGSWPGRLATVVSAFGVTCFLVEPPDSLEIATLKRAVALRCSRVLRRSDCLKGTKTPARNGIAGQESLRASVASTEASNGRLARVGLIDDASSEHARG